MKTKVIDNWLDKDLAEFLKKYLLFDFPHYYGHKSQPEDKTSFYSTYCIEGEPLNAFLIYKLKQTIKKPIDILRMYINVQHLDMNGNFHKDDGDVTCLYMASQSVSKGCEFEIENDKKYKFVNNRLIMFDSQKAHKGWGPLNHTPRITLVFKTKFKNN